MDGRANVAVECRVDGRPPYRGSYLTDTMAGEFVRNCCVNLGIDPDTVAGVTRNVIVELVAESAGAEGGADEAYTVWSYSPCSTLAASGIVDGTVLRFAETTAEGSGGGGGGGNGSGSSTDGKRLASGGGGGGSGSSGAGSSTGAISSGTDGDGGIANGGGGGGSRKRASDQLSPSAEGPSAKQACGGNGGSGDGGGGGGGGGDCGDVDGDGGGGGGGGGGGVLHADHGHRYGNFHNYYHFHSATERLDCLSDELVRQLLLSAQNRREDGTKRGAGERGRRFMICDVGCNDGELTTLMHLKFDARAAQLHAEAASSATSCTDPSKSAPPMAMCSFGVDIDPVLIDRATARLTNPALIEPSAPPDAAKPRAAPKLEAEEGSATTSAASQTVASTPPSAASTQTSAAAAVHIPGLLSFVAADLTDRASAESAFSSFEQSCQRAYPIGGDGSSGDGGAGGPPLFELITVFSVTMWVHLNHGDEGLKNFLWFLADRAR